MTVEIAFLTSGRKELRQRNSWKDAGQATRRFRIPIKLSFPCCLSLPLSLSSRSGLASLGESFYLVSPDSSETSQAERKRVFHLWRSSLCLCFVGYGICLLLIYTQKCTAVVNFGMLFREIWIDSKAYTFSSGKVILWFGSRQGQGITAKVLSLSEGDCTLMVILTVR